MVIFKANFTRNRSVLRWSHQLFNVFLTEVIICSFNDNTLQKWTNGKAFNMMASAQFFATYSVCTFSVTKFQDKFASLRQVNSPYSWNKFQICCTDMYLIRFLPNFAVFFVFLWISRLLDRAKNQKPCLRFPTKIAVERDWNVTLEWTLKVR